MSTCRRRARTNASRRSIRSPTRSRKGDGNLRFEVVQQTSRPNHFTVVEVWKDHKAYDARGAASPQKTFRDKLGPMLGALYDERIYRAID